MTQSINKDNAYLSSFMAIWSGSVSPSSSTITGAHILNTNQPTNHNSFPYVKICHARGGSLHEQNLCLRGCPPPTICAWTDKPYNFAADSFRTKKLCSRLSSREVHLITLHFEPPWGLRIRTLFILGSLESA